MSESTVGVRELKKNLSGYLQKVRSGHTVTITDHKHPVAILEPDHTSREEAAPALEPQDDSFLIWNGEKSLLEPVEPLVLRERVLAADLVLGDRV